MILTTFESLEMCKYCPNGRLRFCKTRIICEYCGGSGLTWVERCSIGA